MVYVYVFTFFANILYFLVTYGKQTACVLVLTPDSMIVA